MSRRAISNKFILFLAIITWASLLSLPKPAVAQNNSNKVMGEVQLAPASQVEKRSGVWIDDQYVGYLSELKGDKKIMLLPGDHEISVRKVGYENFTKFVTVEPGGFTTLEVKMATNPSAFYPGSDAATLKLNIKPKRAAVFVDNGYVGDAGHFGGLNSMQVSPGIHEIKVELPGYRPFETQISLRPGQTSKVETELVSATIQQAGDLIR